MTIRKMIIVLALCALLAVGCTQRDQYLVATMMAEAANTAVAAAKTQAPSVSTQIVKAGATAIADAGKLAATEAVKLKLTTEAGLATEAAKLKLTTEARIATEAAKILPTSANKKPVLDYFALGDSLASGHGLMDDKTECHRSTKAYPYKLRDQLTNLYQTVNFSMLACSGATAGKPDDATLKKDKYKWFRNQVDEVVSKLSNRPTLITISIGANDAKWTNIPALLPHLVEFGGDYYDWVTALKAEISQELLGQIPRLILNRPNVTVVFTTIPNPFNKESIFFHTIVPCTDVLGTLACYERTEMLIGGLNTLYMLEVWAPLGRPGNFKVVPTDVLFANHESPQPACGKVGAQVKDTYIQYPGDPNSNGEVPAVVQTLLTHQKYGDCFHPNEKGAQAVADRVYKYLTESMQW